MKPLSTHACVCMTRVSPHVFLFASPSQTHIYLYLTNYYTTTITHLSTICNT